LLSNWRKAVERVFDRYRGRIKRVVVPSPEPTGKPAAAVLPAKSVNRRRKYAEEQRTRVQAKRRALYETIRQRYAKGEYLKTIARDLGIDYRTARKYALCDECPTRNRRVSPTRSVDGYSNPTKRTWKPAGRKDARTASNSTVRSSPTATRERAPRWRLS
jgi:hypothetical protein